MKLTSAQVERTLGQFEAEAIPDDTLCRELKALIEQHAQLGRATR